MKQLSKVQQKLSIEKFIEKSKTIHNNKYDYTLVTYANQKFTVIIICPFHGKFNQLKTNHSSGSGCRLCGIASSSKAQITTSDEFIAKAKLIHGELYEYSKIDYKLSSKKVIIICEIHGEFEQTPNNHLKGLGCKNCAWDTTLLNISQLRMMFL